MQVETQGPRQAPGRQGQSGSQPASQPHAIPVIISVNNHITMPRQPQCGSRESGQRQSNPKLSKLSLSSDHRRLCCRCKLPLAKNCIELCIVHSPSCSPPSPSTKRPVCVDRLMQIGLPILITICVAFAIFKRRIHWAQIQLRWRQ